MKRIVNFLTALVILSSAMSCEKVPGPDADNGKAVDLGLSVKWADCNVGAKGEADAGVYFAWGETEGKANYSFMNPGEYKWGTYVPDTDHKNDMTKYNSKDGISTLQSDDDAATVVMGNKWRTPTVAELQELLDETKCDWTLSTRKNSEGKEVKGYTVTSKVKGYEGNSIFIPGVGYYYGKSLDKSLNYYWTATQSPNPVAAYTLGFYTNTSSYLYVQTNRGNGLPIRAVQNK